MRRTASFDVFDTLLTRRVAAPISLFHILGERAARAGLVQVSAPVFRVQRAAGQRHPRDASVAAHPVEPHRPGDRARRGALAHRRAGGHPRRRRGPAHGDQGRGDAHRARRTRTEPHRHAGCPESTRGHTHESPFDQLILPAIIVQGEQIINGHGSRVRNDLGPRGRCFRFEGACFGHVHLTP